MSETPPTGHLQVKGGTGNRRYYALWRDADGRHQKLLGNAHIKDSGRRTPSAVSARLAQSGRWGTVSGADRSYDANADTRHLSGGARDTERSDV